MTDAPGVVVLYTCFLEYQNRRREILAALAPRDLPHAPPDAGASPGAITPQPLTGADTS